MGALSVGRGSHFNNNIPGIILKNCHNHRNSLSSDPLILGSEPVIDKYRKLKIT